MQAQGAAAGLVQNICNCIYGDVMTQKLTKGRFFLVTVISSQRIKCNASFESLLCINIISLPLKEGTWWRHWWHLIAHFSNIAPSCHFVTCTRSCDHKSSTLFTSTGTVFTTAYFKVVATISAHVVKLRNLYILAYQSVYCSKQNNCDDEKAHLCCF